MLNRPPPYFPQNQLSPPDEKRYRRFKLVVAGAIVGLIAALTAVGFGVYYLVRLMF
jgi:flagellar biogenesis protein FliO